MSFYFEGEGARSEARWRWEDGARAIAKCFRHCGGGGERSNISPFSGLNVTGISAAGCNLLVGSPHDALSPSRASFTLKQAALC